MRGLLFIAVMLASGCATRRALEDETLARKMHENTIDSRRIFDLDETHQIRAELARLDRRLDYLEQTPKSAAAVHIGPANSTPGVIVPTPDLEAIADRVAAETDAHFCIKALQDQDEFMVNVMCRMNCDAMRNLSSDLEVTDRVQDFISKQIIKCHTARQDRAFNRLVCGKDDCDKGGEPTRPVLRKK